MEKITIKKVKKILTKHNEDVIIKKYHAKET